MGPGAAGGPEGPTGRHFRGPKGAMGRHISKKSNFMPIAMDLGPRGPKKPHGAPWGPMGPRGAPWGPLGPLGPLWGGFWAGFGRHLGPLGPLGPLGTLGTRARDQGPGTRDQGPWVEPSGSICLGPSLFCATFLISSSPNGPD